MLYTGAFRAADFIIMIKAVLNIHMLFCSIQTSFTVYALFGNHVVYKFEIYHILVYKVLLILQIFCTTFFITTLVILSL